MSRKKKQVSNLIDDKRSSGPPPDEGLTTVGLDMFWTPANYVPIKKVEVEDDDDPMLRIL